MDELPVCELEMFQFSVMAGPPRGDDQRLARRMEIDIENPLPDIGDAPNQAAGAYLPDKNLVVSGTGEPLPIG